MDYEDDCFYSSRHSTRGYIRVWTLVHDLLTRVNVSLSRHTAIHGGVVDELVNFFNEVEGDHAVLLSHLHTFLSSDAPSSLVRLYLSPCPGHRMAGDISIRRFIIACKNRFRMHPIQISAHVVLDFCKRLRVSVGVDDELYKDCRGNLGLIVEHVEIENVVNSREYGSSRVSVTDVFGFVVEIANELLGKTLANLSTYDVYEFASFLKPVVLLMGKHKSTLDDNEIQDLRDISGRLCEKVRSFLEELVEGMPSDPCDAIFAILKEAYKIIRKCKDGKSWFRSYMKPLIPPIAYLINTYFIKLLE